MGVVEGSSRRAVYEPQLAKTFENAAANFISKEFPSLGGPKVIGLFVKELKEIVEKYYPPLSHLRMGQVLWFAVARDEKNSYGKGMSSFRLVPVVLSLVTYDDIRKLAEGVDWKSIREEVMARLYREAAAQGGALSETDVSMLLLVSTGLVSYCTRNYEAVHDTILPRVGTLLDCGMSVTHKAEVCRKSKVEKRQTPDIAREIYHSPEDVDRYLIDFDRVRFCLKRGMSVRETSFATKMSKSLVLEYEELIKELYSENKG